MLRIVALNEEEILHGNAEEEVEISKEVQETIAETEYVRALTLKSEGKHEMSLALLNELVQTTILNDLPVLADNKHEKLLAIRYNCHKNMAIMYEERHDLKMALQNYKLGLQLDSSDVYTMHRFGQLALKLNSLELAEFAFENCLRCNPSHWKAACGLLETLCRQKNIMGAFGWALVLHQRSPLYEPAIKTIHDVGMQFYDSIGFYNKFWSLPVNFKSLCKKSSEELISSALSTNSIKQEENIEEKPPCLDLAQFQVKSINWLSIGHYITSVHQHIEDAKENMFFSISFEDIIDVSDDLKTKGKSPSDQEQAFKNLHCLNEDDVSQLCSTDKVQLFKADSISQCFEQSITSELDSTKILNQNVQPDINNDDSDSNTKSERCDVSKPKPRRRCSDLHLLEQWGWHKNRRHSRKKTPSDRIEVDTSVNGFLRRMFSKFMDTSFDNPWPFDISGEDTYNNCASQCADCKKITSMKDFQEDTQNLFDLFLENLKKTSFDLTLLAYKWLKHMSKLWNKRLPDELLDTYLQVFNIYMKHFDFSTWNQLSRKTFKDSYRICLLFLELRYAKTLGLSSESAFWKNIFNHLKFNSGYASIAFEENFESFKLRLVHLEYLWNSFKNDLEMCVTCLAHLEELISEKAENYVLHMPNINTVCLSKQSILKTRMAFQRQLALIKVPKLFQEKKWLEVADIIKNNIIHSKDFHENEDWVKDFNIQIEILLESLWNIGIYEDCLTWSEKLLHYTTCNYMKESRNSSPQKLWAESIDFILSYIEALILNEGFDIVSNLGTMDSRLIQNIIRLLSYQLDFPLEKNNTSMLDLETSRPWVILHQIILREESQSPLTTKRKSSDSEDDEEPIPNSFLILFTAHELLGKRQRCTRDNGAFLHYILDTVTLNLRAPLYDYCRDAVYEYIEQITYCLYGYPQKKPRSRHLEDHESIPVELTWPHAIQLYDLYSPECLPEFNSYKLESISADMEQLLLKIAALMPAGFDLTPITTQIIAFISGHSDFQPYESSHSELPYKIRSIYYLLADYYFKNRDFSRTIKYYTQDLAINPTRFDSWAGMALSKASKIETKLNALSTIDLTDLLRSCEDTVRCFEQCISINRNQTLLWIEYGSFTYTIHSFCSRHLKQSADKLSSEQYSLIKEKKEQMLKISYNCFFLAASLQNNAIQNTDEIDEYHDEKWLCQFMLGKIAEKRKEQPKIYLNYYLTASNYLYESNASYPIKINHSNPTTLSVEALEVFYRINTAILKYLQCNKDIDRSTGDLIKDVLVNLSKSPFAFNKAKIDGNALKRKNVDKIEETAPIKVAIEYVNNKGFPTSNSTGISTDENSKNVVTKDALDKEDAVRESNVEVVHTSPLRRESQESAVTGDTTTTPSSNTTSSSSSSSSSSGSDDDSEASNTENAIETSDNSSTYNPDELKDIYKIVIQNLEECATRFPEHYKSIYRLVFYFMNGPSHLRDNKRCEELLFGQYKTDLGNQVNGLFYDRKINNLFNGIWRIPSSEIDRPGSFSTHLVKCVAILLEYLMKSKNYKLLIDISLQLYRTPDPDKRYIEDNQRMELYHKSINYCAQIMRNVLQKNIEKRDDADVLNLLIDIYKIYKKCLKYINSKEPLFTQLIIDVYTFFILDKVDYLPDSVNLLDLAIKLCLQELGIRKHFEKANNIGLGNSTNLGDAILGIHGSHQATMRPVQIPGITLRNRGRPAAKVPANINSFSQTMCGNPVRMPYSEINLTADIFQSADLMTKLASMNTLSTLQQGTVDFEKLVSEYYTQLLAEKKDQNNTSNLSLPADYSQMSLASLLPLETIITPANSEAKTHHDTHNVFKKLYSQDSYIMPTSFQRSDITITPCDWNPPSKTTLTSNKVPEVDSASSSALNIEGSANTFGTLMKSFTNLEDFKLLPNTSNSDLKDKSSNKFQPKPKSSPKLKQASSKPYNRQSNLNPDKSNPNMFNSYKHHVDVLSSYMLESSNIQSQQKQPSVKSYASTCQEYHNANSATSTCISISSPSPQHESQQNPLPVGSPFAFSNFDTITMTALPTTSIKSNSSVLPKMQSPFSVPSNLAQQLAANPVQLNKKTLQQKLAERQKANQLNEFKAASSTVNDSSEKSNIDVRLGPLPPDFLRINTNQHEGLDCQTAATMYQQQVIPQYLAPNHVGRLSITCAQAKLARNYGLTRMDPYVRVRVGHYVYETQTDPNGGKNPHWNRVIQSQLAAGVNSIYVEIYDECSFKMDELIAWCEIKIPDNVMRCETHEEWYPLSGKQGEGLEGAIDIVLSFSNQPIQPYMYQTIPASNQMLLMPPGRPMPIFVTPQQPQIPNTLASQPIPQLSEAEFKQIHEMFPNIEKEVLKSVYEVNRGNKDATINSLLQMNE